MSNKMASEDVIELGSSEDEVEPQPKKARTRPNAMVHIPTNLSSVTITPASSKATGMHKGAHRKADVTVSKLSVNPLAKSLKTFGKVIPNALKSKAALQNPIPIRKSAVIQKPIQILNKPVGNTNAANILKKLNAQAVDVSRVQPGQKVLNPIKLNSVQAISTLPPGITITRAPGSGARLVRPPKRVIGSTQIRNNMPVKKAKFCKVKASSEVLTVELDDDDNSESTNVSPQWYLRPEEITKNESSSLEVENNKEPEPSNFIEITIEDSPLKPKAVETCQAEDIQSFTIDDSPVKATNTKTNDVNASDEDTSTETKTPHSKKKLEYPKESDIKDTIEIELEPMTDMNNDSDFQSGIINYDLQKDIIVEIEESPVKVSNIQPGTPKKEEPKQTVKFAQEIPQENIVTSGEFHPVYQSFIDLCFKLENSEDMKKIVEKKIKTYYRQVPKEYTESEEFIDLVSGKILAMKAGPEKMYLYIKDIVDELNLQRKMAKIQVDTAISADKVLEVEREKEAASFLYGEDSEFDSKRKRQIRKLEKTLKKLHRAIQKLEEQEVDFEDEEDSVYLLTERYKERMVRVHAKFCQLTNTKMPSEPRVQIDTRPGQPSGPAKRLEKWINKKVPIGTPLPFPDFHDVLRCVREANDEDKLGWNEADIIAEARDLFTRCGSKLQRRRQENEWRLAVSRISLDIDPAENDDNLKKKLEENRQTATKKECELLNKYADKQNQLKLEGEEIGDKEAEESPVESEEEEIVGEGSLENSDKRKERLKRLLQEKSKKNGENTDKQSKAPLATTADVEVTVPKEIEPQPIAKALSGVKESKERDAIESKEEDTIEFKEKDSSESKEKDTTESMAKDTTPENLAFEEANNDKEDLDDKHKSKIDDENELESDVDELHLLQKLHSENEVNSSTPDSSDSDFTITISDTLESDNDTKKQNQDDVISIENSSYSESEMNKEINNIETVETSDESDQVVPEDMNDDNADTKSVANDVKKTRRINDDECNELIEDILLASSDEEEELNQVAIMGGADQCVNLKDDNLSIGETVVEGTNKNNDNIEEKHVDASKKISLQNYITKQNENREDSKKGKSIYSEDIIFKDNYVILDDDGLSADGVGVENTHDNNEKQSKITNIIENDNGECASLGKDLSRDEMTVDHLDVNNIQDVGVVTSDNEHLFNKKKSGDENKNNEEIELNSKTNEIVNAECISIDDENSADSKNSINNSKVHAKEKQKLLNVEGTILIQTDTASLNNTGELSSKENSVENKDIVDDNVIGPDVVSSDHKTFDSVSSMPNDELSN